VSKRTERIPFQVEVSRIIEVLAKQIYQSPLALLRENSQNAFDAILLRQYRDPAFTPQLDIRITPSEIEIRDNGIGMSPSDLREHYWHAGSSSKNTAEAREAGVVGTFGIGAMANFGIADELRIETESAITGERTLSYVRKEDLSTTAETIALEAQEPTGEPGTSVTARIDAGTVDVAEASAYIREFVTFVTLPVSVNGELVSQQSVEAAVPRLGDRPVDSHRNVSLTSDVAADIEMSVARTGELWLKVGQVQLAGRPTPGEFVLRQGGSNIRTFRSGFGLATVAVRSFYQLGGVVNMSMLQPTAGREALTTDSMQLLQSIIDGLETFASLELAGKEESDNNTNFMEWVRKKSRFDLCDNLKVRIEPGDRRRSLAAVRDGSTSRPALVYAGSDAAIIAQVATDDTPLVILASGNPRRQCESQYLLQYCQITSVEDSPTILREFPPSRWSVEQQAIAFRLTAILDTDYFLKTIVTMGELSHGLAIVADIESDPVRVVLDPRAPTFALLEELYRENNAAFSSMVKDFVRNMVFPKVADRVPSSTRQGAQAFLKTVGRTRDVFEYERGDLDSLSSVWSEYLEGRLSMEEATDRSTQIVRRSVQLVDSSTAQAARDVVPDVLDNEEALAGEEQFGPAPPIMRTEIATDAKLLTIAEDETAVKGFRCFIALSERARDENGDFFLQPHSTSIVWGGQKLLFIFEHHSEEFGLYYDLQTSQVVAAASGGGPVPTATIILQDKIFIPIPPEVTEAFIPAVGERKRFEVRSDLLFTDR
jgi:molecular chaperone HtpG